MEEEGTYPLSRYRAQTMTFIEAKFIRQEVMLQLLMRYPTITVELKRLQMRFRLGQEVLAYAAAHHIVCSEVRRSRWGERSAPDLVSEPRKALYNHLRYREEVNPRVAHYAYKLRLFLIAPSKEKAALYDRSARKLQAWWRRRHLVSGVIDQTRVRSARKTIADFYLNSTASSDPFEQTVVMQLNMMSRMLHRIEKENRHFLHDAQHGGSSSARRHGVSRESSFERGESSAASYKQNRPAGFSVDRLDTKSRQSSRRSFKLGVPGKEDAEWPPSDDEDVAQSAHPTGMSRRGTDHVQAVGPYCALNVKPQTRVQAAGPFCALKRSLSVRGAGTRPSSPFELDSTASFGSLQGLDEDYESSSKPNRSC